MARRKMKFINIYTEIAKYYPIGIKNSSNIYGEFPGIKMFHEKCFTKLEPALFNKWKGTLNIIKENSKSLRVSSESPLSDPSYTGKFILQVKKMGQAVYSRVLVVQLSILAPFFTIYGIDTVTIKTSTNEKIIFPPLIYCSPDDTFNQCFHSIREVICANYKEYQFVNFSFAQEVIPQLYVPEEFKAREKVGCTIYQALFSPIEIFTSTIKGDPTYE